MQVIAHHRKTQHIDRKNPCQDFQSFANPLFPMRKVSARLPILPAQKRPAHAAIDQMKRLNLIVRKNLSPIHPWHRTTPQHPRLEAYRPTSQNSIKTSFPFIKCPAPFVPLPEAGRWKDRRHSEKFKLLKMEFRTFVNTIIRIPCQILTTGRRTVYRLLAWNDSQPIFWRMVKVLNL